VNYIRNENQIAALVGRKRFHYCDLLRGACILNIHFSVSRHNALLLHPNRMGYSLFIRNSCANHRGAVRKHWRMWEPNAFSSFQSNLIFAPACNSINSNPLCSTPYFRSSVFEVAQVRPQTGRNGRKTRPGLPARKTWLRPLIISLLGIRAKNTNPLGGNAFMKNSPLVSRIRGSEMRSLQSGMRS